MLHSTKSAPFSQKYYFFITDKMCFVAGSNAFACLVWSAGRSLETYNKDCEVEWWQHTPLSESKPTMNGCDVTPPTWTQLLSRNAVTWRLITGSRQHRVPTTLPTALREEPGHILYRCRQNTRQRLWHAPKISRNFATYTKMVIWPVMLQPRQNRIGCHPAWIQ